ncbi:MAG TPA: FadR/GntR family transcriptional regulator [Rectinemataceae bacterium]|nr:FadR/GntR family transcriptional regulator [Rectinemataceae bacterium]
MSIERIKRVSVVEQAIDKIYELIVARNLRTNDRLPPERELSEMLGISRNSLREAIRVLDVLGIIRVDQGSGMVIDATKVSDAVTLHLSFALMLNRDKFRELFEARLIFETECAGLAAERATDEEIAELRETYAKLVESRADRAKGIEYELSLHAITARAAHNTVLEKILSSLRQVLRESREQTVPSSGVTPATVELQEKIIDAISGHDKNSARTLMYEHIAAVAQRVEEGVKKTNAEKMTDQTGKPA